MWGGCKITVKQWEGGRFPAYKTGWRTPRETQHAGVAGVGKLEYMNKIKSGTKRPVHVNIQ